MKTLEEARAYIEKHLKDGVICPCCDRHVKVYRRKFNQIMAIGLVNLVAKHSRTNDWVHVYDIRLGDRDVRAMGGSFALLTKWGMIVPKVNQDTQKRCSGFWKPTIKGIRFATGHISTPRYADCLNNRVIGWSEEEATIDQAFSTKFDYQELISKVRLSRVPQAQRGLFDENH